LFLNKKVISLPPTCVGCGFCCKESICLVGIRYFISLDKEIKLADLKDGCPALTWNGQRYVCELVSIPGQEGEDLREDLNIGTKCCSPETNWRNDIKERKNKKTNV
jgi:hypothetical protein